MKELLNTHMCPGQRGSMVQAERDPFDLNSLASVPSRQFLPTEALIVPLLAVLSTR